MEDHFLSNDFLIVPKKKKKKKKKKSQIGALWLILFVMVTVSGFVFKDNISCWILRQETNRNPSFGTNFADIVESQKGVVAADDSRCSETGALILRQGGHAVDAAVATALCVGVVNPMASGIGGGSFMLVRSSATSKTQAFNMRETAPLAATKDMYENDTNAKYRGALSMGVPGEIAGLHKAWLQHGRLPWKTLFQPAIKLAREGFTVAPYLGQVISTHSAMVLNDTGLRKVFAPKGYVLKAGETCYNAELAWSLEAVAEQGPRAFYDGTVGENLVKDAQEAGGIVSMEDLRSYKVKITDAMSVDAMGYTIHGMPAPSSGTIGFSMVMNILDSYARFYAANGNLGLHRLIEATKHMFAARMDLGDPDFVNITNPQNEMLSLSRAKEILKKILDNTTFSPDYYRNRWSQLRDHGTSHFCIVDADRNAVSMTTTVNYAFGAGILSASTGIVLNNEMGDFSIPTENTPDMLPPAPANFIEPDKRPLSSMTPLIITKGDKVIGAIGGSGGMQIIPAVIQVFLNHFVLGLNPLAAVQSPRVYHFLIPNVVFYENWTVIDGDHIELADDSKLFLKERGHELRGRAGGAIVQLVVQTFQEVTNTGKTSSKDSKNGKSVHGTLTAVSDPRKDGKPAAV